MLLLAGWLVACAWGAPFGQVVAIGGQASDIALDEARGVLYIANFTAARVEVMSLSSNSINSSINVPDQPAALALSPNGRYLVVVHYAEGSGRNAVTVLDRDAGLRQTVTLASAPLGVAFGRDGLALIATTTDIFLFDPVSCVATRVSAMADLTPTELPVEAGKVPTEIVAASLGASADGEFIFGLTDSFQFTYQVSTRQLSGLMYTSDPKMAPRTVSAAKDGSFYAAGWAVYERSGVMRSQFHNPSGAMNIGSLAVSSDEGVIYAQVAENDQAATNAMLSIVDSDNLAVRERLYLRENLAGRSVFNAAGDTLYAASESGVTVLPVGSLSRARRVSADREDVVFRGSFCQRRVLSQEFKVTDASGGGVAFRLISGNPAVRVAPSMGTTPATIRVEVDPGSLAESGGTVQTLIQIEAPQAINAIAPVRVVVNNRAPEQRGWLVDVPGTLVDLLADPVRDRFYVLRQDRNQVLVYDGTGLNQVAVLKTLNTPTQMALTRDRKHLMVGHHNAQAVAVFDLDTLQAVDPIRMPFGHYPRSIAASNRAILAACRSAALPHAIDRLDMAARRGVAQASLGIFKNDIDMDTVLAAAPNGTAIFAASADGTLMAYDANADRFTAGRKTGAALAGTYAASDNGMYVAGDMLLNSSLVPAANFSAGTAGAAFLGGAGLRSTSAGVIERFDASGGTRRSTPLIEKPAAAAAGSAFIRTLGVLANGNIVALTASGVSVLSSDYDAAVAIPRIDRIVSAADGGEQFAPGSLVSVYGANLTPTNLATREIPMAAAIGESCLTANGSLVPLIFSSPSQLNAQLPFDLSGRVTLTLRTVGGSSDNYMFNLLEAAPGVFRSGTAGPLTQIPAIVRMKNQQVVTPSNPVHPEDELLILAAGLGRVTPEVEAGTAAPADPQPRSVIQPVVRLGGIELPVDFAGLVPEQVGVYEIRVRVPWWIPEGSEVPLVIEQAGSTTAVPVRVVK